ncbi:MAG: hypothetical protein H7X95_00560 [Deltaproteobacteria bacterium]|nr:hypothetical protein [Deltaproteobacteria bacterium]
MVLACLVLVRSTPAAAYVRARTEKTFLPLFWTDPRKALEIALPPAGVGVTDAELRGAAQAAVSSWSYPRIACTGISLRLGGESMDSQVAGRDGKNRIIMRVGHWCRDPVALKFCHDEAAVAVTTLFSRRQPLSPKDGEILEADIELNAVDQFEWGIIPEGPISGRDFANIYDVASVLTHEMGHFIGLDHNCLPPKADPLVDDQDRPVPSCFDLPSDKQASIEDATMYPFTDTTDVRLRSLSPDETRAACEMYPIDSLPVYEWIGAGGCSHAPLAKPDGPLRVVAATILMAVLGLFLRMRRRTRPSQSTRNPAPIPRNQRLS